MRYCAVCCTRVADDDPVALAHHLESHAEDMAVAREWHAMTKLVSNGDSAGGAAAAWRALLRRVQDDRFGEAESAGAVEGVRALHDLLPGMGLVPFGSWISGTAERGKSDVDLSILSAAEVVVRVSGIRRASYKVIIGRDGCRRRELERRSHTFICVPRVDEDVDYITIAGESKTAVHAAVSDIKALLRLKHVAVAGPFTVEPVEGEKMRLKRACDRLQDTLYLPQGADGEAPFELLTGTKVPILRLTWQDVPTKENTLKFPSPDAVAGWVACLQHDFHFPHTTPVPGKPLAGGTPPRIYFRHPPHDALRARRSAIWGAASVAVHALRFLQDVAVPLGLSPTCCSIATSSFAEMQDLFGADAPQYATGNHTEYLSCADAATKVLMSRVLVAATEMSGDQESVAQGELVCASWSGALLCQRIMRALAQRAHLQRWVPTPPVLYVPECVAARWDVTARPHLGPRNTVLLREVLQGAGEAAFVAGCALKRWAKLHGVSDSRNGYLSSYALLLMLCFYLQQCGKAPHVDVEAVDVPLVPTYPTPRRLMPEEEVECRDILLGFFAYYTAFDWRARAVTLNAPPHDVVAPSAVDVTVARTLASLARPRRDHVFYEMVVYDPYEDVNTARRITYPKLVFIRGVFAATHHLLTDDGGGREDAAGALSGSGGAARASLVEQALLDSPLPHDRIPAAFRALAGPAAALAAGDGLERERLFMPEADAPLPDVPLQQRGAAVTDTPPPAAAEAPAVLQVPAATREAHTGAMPVPHVPPAQAHPAGRQQPAAWPPQLQAAAPGHAALSRLRLIPPTEVARPQQQQQQQSGRAPHPGNGYAGVAQRAWMPAGPQSLAAPAGQAVQGQGRLAWVPASGAPPSWGHGYQQRTQPPPLPQQQQVRLSMGAYLQQQQQQLPMTTRPQQPPPQPPQHIHLPMNMHPQHPHGTPSAGGWRAVSQRNSPAPTHAHTHGPPPTVPPSVYGGQGPLTGF